MSPTIPPPTLEAKISDVPKYPRPNAQDPNSLSWISEKKYNSLHKNLDHNNIMMVTIIINCNEILHAVLNTLHKNTIALRITLKR